MPVIKPPNVARGLMSEEELVIYMVGMAVMRQFENHDRDPDTVKALAEVSSWVEHWLSETDLDFLAMQGWLFGSEVPDELQRWQPTSRKERPPSDDPDDIIPF